MSKYRNNKLKGTGVALITPFKEDFSIDFNSLDKLIEHLIYQSIDYFVIMGTTGESVTLSIEEQNLLLNHIVKKVDNRIPLVFGLGGNSTSDVLFRISSLDFTGIEAILSVSPYYNKPSQEGLFQHYSQIAECSSVDVIIYNVPSRTASNIKPDTVSLLCKKYKNIIGIKEASGDISQCMEIILKCPNDFMLISGDDKMTFPIMMLGGAGVISVQAMVLPFLFTNMIKSCFLGDFLEAKRLHYELLKSVDLLYVDGNPAGIKEALYFTGICSSSQVRLPLTKMKDENIKKLHLALSEY